MKAATPFNFAGLVRLACTTAVIATLTLSFGCSRSDRGNSTYYAGSSSYGSYGAYGTDGLSANSSRLVNDANRWGRETGILLNNPNSGEAENIRRRDARDLGTQQMLNGYENAQYRIRKMDEADNYRRFSIHQRTGMITP